MNICSELYEQMMETIFYMAVCFWLALYIRFTFDGYAKTYKFGFAKYAVDANLFGLGSSIQKYALLMGAAPVEGTGGRSQ